MGAHEGITECGRATEGGLGEVVVDSKLVVKFGGEREVAIQKVGFVEVDIDELAKSTDLCLQRQGLTGSE